jgi:hypothetical protein
VFPESGVRSPTLAPRNDRGRLWRADARIASAGARSLAANPADVNLLAGRGAGVDAECGTMEARVCYFIAVCRYGSFRAAAQACGVSTPAVSMGVQRLERALGSNLFERRRPVRLTPLARELWPMLEQLHGLADHIDRTIATRTAAGGDRGGAG